MATVVPRSIGRAVVTARLRLLSGLHIGAGKDSVEIGGIDNPVVRHPHSRLPYIPGSSLKGRLRFILEWALGKINVRKNTRGEYFGEVWGFGEEDPDPTDPILRIFGVAAKRWTGGPTRLLVRDCFLTEEWQKKAKDPAFAIVEEKNEVAIDRIAGKAMDGRLRTTERVPAGVEFDVTMVFRMFDFSPLDGPGPDLEYRDLAWLLQALDLLEHEALGGSGSRGYGRIRFEDPKLRMPDWEQARALDNVFRGRPFSSEAPAQELVEFVKAGA